MADSPALTLELFVAEAEPAGTEGWEELLGAARDELQRVLPGVAVTAWRHDPAALGGLAHGDETAQAPPFVAAVQLRRIDPAQLGEVLTILAKQLNQLVDRPRSTVLVGEELTVVPGEEPLMLAMALPRKEGLGRADFQRYWSTNHAELGRRVPGSQGYRQVHTDAAATDQARRILGVNGPDFDGVAVACYADRAAFLSIMANEEIIGRLLEDERTFIDHSRAAMVVGYALD